MHEEAFDAETTLSDSPDAPEPVPQATRGSLEGGPLFGVQFSEVTRLEESRTFAVVVEGTAGDAGIVLTGEWLAPGIAMAAGASFTHRYTFSIEKATPPGEDGFEFIELRVESDIVEGDYVLTITGTLIDGTLVEQTSEIGDATPADLFAAIDTFIEFVSTEGDLL